PIVVMEKYGTDAFRFTLAALAQGRDIRISEERIEGYRNFANKIWNASRLVLSNLSGFDPALAKKTPPALADVWIESRLAATVAEARTALKKYRFSDAASVLYQFLWHEFCDWYLEIAKLSLYHAENPGQRARTQATLVRVLETTLRPGPDAGDLFTANGALIDALGRARLTIDPAATRPRSSAMAVIGGSELYVDLTGVVDLAAERQRIQKEIAKATERVEFLKGKLSKPDFAERAPAEIVAKERERLVEQEALHAKLVASLGWVDDGGR